jgi:hypothetical protein
LTFRGDRIDQEIRPSRPKFHSRALRRRRGDARLANASAAERLQHGSPRRDRAKIFRTIDPNFPG